ncbi:MAG: ATP-binding protein [Gemmatimonadota bacterium]
MAFTIGTGSGALQQWRDRILTAVLWTLVIGGFVAWLPSTIMAFRGGLWGVIAAGTGSYLFLVVLLLARRVSFRRRAGAVVVLIYLLGLFFTLQFGPFAAGLLWLFAFPILAALLFGVRPALAALILTAATLGAVGYQLSVGALSWSSSISVGLWAVIAGSFLALDALVAVSVGVLLEGLSSTAVALEQQLLERARIEEQLMQAAKLEALGRLAGGVAHDFNNILTAILGAVELLLPRFSPEDPDSAELAGIADAATRAAGLTRQLLAFSRQQIIQPRVMDLGVVVSGLEHMLRRLLRENVNLKLVIATGLPAVRGDPGQLGQVVLNLALNAADAMPDGGTLSIELSAATVNAELAAEHGGLTPGRYVMMVVRDTGVGIPPELQERIFEPFFTTKGPGQGTGLGLAMVYGVIKEANGDIWLQSKPGLGTSFQVCLPAVFEPLTPTTPAPAGRPIEPGHGEGILLLEDDEAVRHLVGRQLRRNGYAVHAAAEGDEAIRLATRLGAGIQLLLTDVVMPGMNGPEVAALIRQQRPGLKVLYMSGYTDDAFRRDVVFAPGEAFLQKPFSEADLSSAVRRLLEGE